MCVNQAFSIFFFTDPYRPAMFPATQLAGLASGWAVCSVVLRMFIKQRQYNVWTLHLMQETQVAPTHVQKMFSDPASRPKFSYSLNHTTPSWTLEVIWMIAQVRAAQRVVVRPSYSCAIFYI